MSKSSVKKSSMFDENVMLALKKMASFNQKADNNADAEGATAPQPPKQDAIAQPDALADSPAEQLMNQFWDAIWKWYRDAKPRTMQKFIWMVMLSCQSARTGGIIVIDDFAAALQVDSKKVLKALNDLAREKRIEVKKIQYGARRKIISKTIQMAL